MAIDVDGFAVLGAIAAHPALFASLKPEVAKTARALVGKQLKDKGLTHDALRRLAEAIGPEAFDLVADAMSDQEVKAVLAKVDRHGVLEVAAQRAHLMALAHGRAAPASPAATKAAKPPKAVKEPKPAVERAGNSKAMRATRKR